ncbi:hypothetical protein [Herbidospora cretacea]|uniref:hypothetical protein n=1 Tax=Herbidospora cretacea TaxID=28444 RepID=UPI000772E01B|nr:hypothetical protein [Herbidospora cretacea]
MSVMRDELRDLVDQLPEEKVAPVLRLVRDQFADSPKVRHLPWIGTMEAGPDFAERSEDILRSGDNHPL